MITEQDYRRTTNCSWDCCFPEFTFEEVKTLLSSWGYKVILHNGLAKVEDVQMGFNEVIRTSNFEDREREIILAVKESDIIPARTDEAVKFALKSVFYTELKLRLMKLLM